MAIKTKRFINNVKNCSCSMPGVWRAVAYCKGAVVIFHSPKACAHVTRTMDINACYRISSNDQIELLSSVPLLSTQMEEKHSIFGGISQLEKCAEFAIENYKPKCLLIANSCVAGVIGDDVESVARKIQYNYNLPVITVDCYGFLDGEYYQGYFEVTEKLIDTFLKPMPKKLGTVVLLGDNGGPWGHYAKEVTRLLNKLNVEVIGQFPGYLPVEELSLITQAEAAIILGGRSQSTDGLVRIAAELNSKFGIKYFDGVYPIGLNDTKKWILNVGQLMNCQDAAGKLIKEEEEYLCSAIKKYLPYTSNKKVVLCIGRLLEYFEPGAVLEIIDKLHLDLRSIVLLNAYDEKSRNQMKAAIEKYTDVCIFSDEISENLLDGIDLVLTTHELKNKNIKQLFLPMLPNVGTAGELNLMQAVYRILCSKITHGGIIYV